MAYKLDRKIKLPTEIDLLFHLHTYDIDLLNNHIYLVGVDRGYASIDGDGEPGIEHMIASRFIKNINLCMRVNPEKPIIVHMKTNGGWWEEGMAIYDAIKACPSKVTILNYTHARSMSSIIFQAADKRVMMPHSHFMFHDGTYGIEGTVKQVRSSIEFDKKNTITMLNIYANQMNDKGEMQGKGIIKIKQWLKSQMDKKEDVFLSAEETIHYGLADEIFDYDWCKLSKY